MGKSAWKNGHSMFGSGGIMRQEHKLNWLRWRVYKCGYEFEFVLNAYESYKCNMDWLLADFRARLYKIV